jgi:hypothetical protein
LSNSVVALDEHHQWYRQREPDTPARQRDRGQRQAGHRVGRRVDGVGKPGGDTGEQRVRAERLEAGEARRIVRACERPRERRDTGHEQPGGAAERGKQGA